jgi:S1-C subfamily serine protease
MAAATNINLQTIGVRRVMVGDPRGMRQRSVGSPDRPALAIAMSAPHYRTSTSRFPLAAAGRHATSDPRTFQRARAGIRWVDVSVRASDIQQRVPAMKRTGMISVRRSAAAAMAPALVLISSLSVSGPARAASVDDDSTEAKIRDSVVKISATVRNPDLTTPWTKGKSSDVSGTGVVIEGKRILTNAHVVTYASQLFVEGNQSSDKLPAQVLAVSPAMDLAVLKLDDESFFEKRTPMPRTTALPQVKETVLAYGFPQGGSTLSITKGIVSRIEFTVYNDGAQGVRVQVDAAINPGNSGGPALIDGKMIGVVFSKVARADNIGYIIPSEEVDLFLKDVADGHYDGKPAMHEPLQTLENDALRSFLRLDKKTQGMVVHAPNPADPNDPLKHFDLITKIGDHEIDNTGMVKINDQLRLRFQYFIQKLAKDGKVPLTVIRQGKTMKIDLPVKPHYPRLFEPLQGKYPSYFVYGPLVFSPVSGELLGALGGGSAFLAAIGSPLVTRMADQPKFEGEQLVIVSSKMFPHRIAKGYDNPGFKVVKEINGIKVKNIRHMVELLRDSKEKYTTIGFDDRNSETIVFDHKEALNATEEVLSDNGIREQASDDLMAVWTAKKK